MQTWFTEHEKKKNQNGHPCRFAIANGLMIGTAPRCIEDLNDVELAMVSKGRCEKHIFSYSAGAHTQIRGFHTIYQNDVHHSNSVLNYMEQRSAANLTGVGDIGEEREEENDNGSADIYDSNNSDSGVENQQQNTPICVILAGPFTATQVALTKLIVQHCEVQ